MNDLYRIALHEAGHAAVASALGGRVDSIKADRNGGEVRASIPYEKALHFHCAYFFAGAMAERLILGLLDASPSPEDQAAVDSLLAGADTQERVRTIEKAWPLAAMLVRRNQTTIERMARYLETKGSASSAALKTLLPKRSTRA